MCDTAAVKEIDDTMDLLVPRLMVKAWNSFATELW
jgi:hypothetical protein